MGGLLIAIGQFGKAEYNEALDYYKKGLAIEEKNPIAPNHQSLAISHNNIGGVYFQMEEYVKALAFYEKDIQICEKALPSDHYLLGISCDNIGNVYVVIRAEHRTTFSVLSCPGVQ